MRGRLAGLVLLALGLSLALLGLGSAAPTQPLVGNGGFESPSIAGTETYPAGSTALSPWQVSGAVKLVRSSKATWPAAEGKQSLDLLQGTIAQDLVTTAGTFYTLTFAYAAAPTTTCAPSLVVRWGSGSTQAQVGSTFRPTVPPAGTQPSWTSATIQVRATASTARLEFVGSGCASGGVALDDVVLAQAQGTPSLDGVGQMLVAPATAVTSSTGTYLFRYQADPAASPNPKLSNGTVTLTVPPPPTAPATGWTAPQTTDPGSPGYVSVAGTAATLSIDPADPRTVVVSGLNMDLDAGDTLTITYASAKAPSTPGPSTFVARQKSNNGGSLAALTTSPVVQVTSPPNGKGTMVVSTAPPTTPPSVEASASAKTLTFRYATDASVGISGGSVRLAIPNGWTAPTTGNVALAAPAGSNATLTIQAGSRLVTVTGTAAAPLTLPAGGGTAGSFTLTYTGSPPTSTLAPQTFETRELSSPYGSLDDDASKLLAQPVVLLTAPPQSSSPLQVNTTSDTPVDPGCSFAPGDCTLREAVVLAGDEGYEVRFDLSGQPSLPATIQLSSPLTFTKPVDIDGLTGLVPPSGASTSSLSCPTSTSPAPVLAVQIAPSGYAGDGIVLGPGSSGSSIRGLSIGGFASAIVVDGSSDNTVTCNLVGKTGSTGIPNTGDGITIKGATSANAIGSAGTVADRNVIAGNGGAGIAVAGDAALGNEIDGNSFAENAGPGIDLVTSPPGIPLNDVGDADTGPNGAQNAPILIATSRQDGLFGGIKAAPATTYRIVLYASPTCDDSGAGEGKVVLGSLDVTTGKAAPDPGGPAPGEGLFSASGSSSVLAAAASLDPATTWYVTATATGPEGTSEFSPCSILVERDNSVWSQALTVPTNGEATTGYIDTPGKSRWYRFPISPNGKVTISLRNLPPGANYDIVAFSDIGKAYQQLSGAPPTLASLSEQGAETPQNATNSSQYSTSALEPTTIDPNVNVAGSAYFGSAYFGSAYFGSAYFGSAYFGSAYFGSAYFGSAYFGSAYFDDKAFSNAQTTSVLGLSASLGSDPETLTLNTWNNTGYFYVRVLSPTGDTSLQDPFTLTVQDEGSACAGVAAAPDATGLYEPAAGSKETLILTDGTKLDLTSLGPKLSSFAGRSDVNGLVVDVNLDSAVRAFRAQADQHPGCPYAANLLAGAIKRIVTATRAANPGLRYVVLAGGDDVIPFFRTPDRTQIGHESTYFPPVKDESASNASLRLGYVLGQDAYGASVELDVKGTSVPVPKIPVGRLVETPSQIIGMLDAYESTGGVITPASSLTTGYDFVQDGADAIAATLQEGIGGARNQTLITAQGVPPTTTSPPSDRDHSWTAADLKARLLDQSAAHAPDLVFLGGHFSAADALAADYSTTVTTTDLVSRAGGAGANYFQNSLVFSVGCHSGYNTLDGAAIIGVTQPLDWPQAFARVRATLVAGTGFQYGDTDFVRYSEQLYAEFANQLRTGSGPVSIGDALVEAKQLYLQQYGAADAIDEKVVLQSTIWGLPMMKVAMPNRVPAPTVGSDLQQAPAPVASEPGQTLGLQTAMLELTPTLTPQSKTLTDSSTSPASSVGVSWLEGSDGVVANPAQPTLPLESLNVGRPTTVLRGVGFRGGTYTDLAGRHPLTGAPGTELSGVHVPFFSDVFFPLSLATVNYTGGLDGTGGSAKERLLVTPAQYRSDPANPTANVLRTYSDVSLKLFYSGNTDSYCFPSGGGAPYLLTGQACAAGEKTITPANAGPPIIASVDSSIDAGNVTFNVHVVGDPRAGIQETWITWTDPTAAVKKWQSVPLALDASGDTTLWTGALDLGGADPANVRFMVQSANGVGLVTRDDHFGAYYAIAGLAESNAQATVTTLGEPVPASPGKYSGLVSVTATVTSAGVPVALKPVRFTLGPTSVVAFTGVNGVATTPFLISAPPGSYDLTATLIGDGAYRTSSAVRPYTVVQMPTVTSLTAGSGPVKVGDRTGVVATVTNENGRPVADRAVLFVATPTAPAGADVAVAVVKTNYLGKVELNAPQLSPGAYTITAYFGQQKMVGGVAYDLRDAAYGGSASDPVALAVTSPLALTKSAAPTNVGTVGETVTYTYALTNTGEAPLDGPVTVTDERPLTQAGPGGGTVAANTPFECFAGPLAPGATKSCTAKTTVTQADLDAATGTVTASATALATFGVAAVPSNTSSASFSVTQSPALALSKGASPSTYLAAGDVISYAYTIRNAGNVTLPGPFSASDDHLGSPLGAPFTCGSGPLTPGAQTSCTKSYTITAADVTAGSVTNKATATTSFKAATVTSNEATATVASRIAIQLTGTFPTGSVAKNNYVWFNANLNVGALSQPAGSSIVFRGVTLSFCALPSSTTACTTSKVTKIALPDTVITFTGVGTTATTVTVDTSGRWIVSVPSGYGGAVFLSGLSWKSTSSVYIKAPPSPGTVFEGALEGAPSGCYRAQWGAAQYPGNFSPSAGALKVKPISSGLPYWADTASLGDLAGTPEGPPNSEGSYKASVLAWPSGLSALVAPIGARSVEQPFGRCS